MAPAGTYVLGHADAELERLGTQAALIDPITRRFFQAAGISRGMRVLDVGSGAGHTAMLLAESVGPEGDVVGVDPALPAIETATRRAAAAGLANLRFLHGDPAAIDLGPPYDAIAGRYVLMFLPDPAAALARLARHLKPGGIVVFHEPDWIGARCVPPVADYERVVGQICAALHGSGAAIDLGGRLGRVFADAGFPSPTLRLEAAIGCGPAAKAVVRLMTDLATTLRPDIERLGLVAPGDPPFADTAEGIIAALGSAGTAVGRLEIAAWTTV